MGFDISYHPINKEEIQKWYFDVLENPSLINNLGELYGIDPFYVDKYKEVIEIALKTTDTDEFDTTHGYYIAVIQGLFRKYYYTRGSAFSFLKDENADFTGYTTDWQQIVPISNKNPKANTIVSNYSSGGYISDEQVKQLLSDFENKSKIKQALIEFYSHGRIEVFIAALQYAAENNLGLLEASEVIEPNPLDLNKSTCYSNLFNCDTEGALLYRASTLEQIREIENNADLTDKEIAEKASYKKVNTDKIPADAENKSFWKKLFGK